MAGSGPRHSLDDYSDTFLKDSLYMICLFVYIYIYIQYMDMNICVYLYIYIQCIYIYIYIYMRVPEYAGLAARPFRKSGGGR